MVMVRVPVVAELLAVNVTVLVPVVGLGLKAAVVPLPRPEADSVTLPAKPPDFVIVMVLVPFPPRRMVRLVGEAESVKLPPPTAVTVRETVAVWVMPPPVPVTVMG